MHNLVMTKIARTILRKAGFDNRQVYTNKYKTCRTVKVGANPTEEQLNYIRERVAQFIPSATVKVNKFTHPSGCYVASSIIIRLPYEA